MDKFKQDPTTREYYRRKHMQNRRERGVQTIEERVVYEKQKFIESAIKKHDGKYEYNDVNYINQKTKVQIRCMVHGSFIQTPSAHLAGQGCPTCAHEARVKSRKRKTTETFVKEATIIHSGKYIYDNVEYINTKSKVKIACLSHGIFEQQPKAHLAGQGCPDCANEVRMKLNESKPEREIAELLDSMGVTYEREKTFDDCVNGGYKLRFDFYIPTLNMLIEYDGEQHYRFIKRFHRTQDGFQRMQTRDNIKDEYAKSNDIVLHRIRYDEDHLSHIAKVVAT